MRFLLFADLHQFDVDDLGKITEDFDAIVFLGDINAVTIRCILNRFPDKPAYAVLGNHDDISVFTSVNNMLTAERRILSLPFVHHLKDINLVREVCKDASFAGLQGSVKYKDKMVGYTQAEASLLDIPNADILFSHDTGYHFLSCGNDNVTHEGFRAISDYIADKKPQFHIFGHHHKDIQFQKEETICFCVYGCSVFDSKQGNIKKIF